MANVSDTIIGTDRDYRTGAIIHGNDVIAQQVVKRITTAPGTMFWDLKSMSIDDSLLDKTSQSGVKQMETVIQSLFSNDPRFTVSAQVFIVQRALTIRLVVTPTSDLTPIIVTYIPSTNEIKVERK